MTVAKAGGPEKSCFWELWELPCGTRYDAVCFTTLHLIVQSCVFFNLPSGKFFITFNL